MTWPRAVRRPRAQRARALRRQRGAARRGRAGRGPLDLRPPDRSAAAALRHRGAARALPAGDRPGRVLLRDRHERARRRLGPRCGAHPGRAGRRRLARCTGRRSGRATPSTPPRDRAVPHERRRGDDRHAGLSQLIVDLRGPGVDIRPIRITTGRAALQRGRARRRAGARRAWSWARSATAGRRSLAELAHERSGPERFLSTIPLLTALAERLGADALTTPPSPRRSGALVARLVALRRMSLGVAAAIQAGRRAGDRGRARQGPRHALRARGDGRGPGAGAGAAPPRTPTGPTRRCWPTPSSPRPARRCAAARTRSCAGSSPAPWGCVERAPRAAAGHASSACSPSAARRPSSPRPRRPGRASCGRCSRRRACRWPAVEEAGGRRGRLARRRARRGPRGGRPRRARCRWGRPGCSPGGCWPRPGWRSRRGPWPPGWGAGACGPAARARRAPAAARWPRSPGRVTPPALGRARRQRRTAPRRAASTPASARLDARGATSPASRATTSTWTASCPRPSATAAPDAVHARTSSTSLAALLRATQIAGALAAALELSVVLRARARAVRPPDRPLPGRPAHAGRAGRPRPPRPGPCRDLAVEAAERDGAPAARAGHRRRQGARRPGGHARRRDRPSGPRRDRLHRRAPPAPRHPPSGRLARRARRRESVWARELGAAVLAHPDGPWPAITAIGGG